MGTILVSLFAHYRSAAPLVQAAYTGGLRETSRPTYCLIAPSRHADAAYRENSRSLVGQAPARNYVIVSNFFHGSHTLVTLAVTLELRVPQPGRTPLNRALRTLPAHCGHSLSGESWCRVRWRGGLRFDGEISPIF